jgi:hypothetical protein
MHDSPNRRAAGVALLAAAVAATAACASRPDVRHDQDASVDLTAYRSFAFYDSPALRYTSLLEQRLRQATRAQLERAHCVYDERDPDLRVNYLLHVLDKQELRSTPGTGYRGWNGARLETVVHPPHSADVRSLRVVLQDVARLWRVCRAIASSSARGVGHDVRPESKCPQPGPSGLRFNGRSVCQVVATAADKVGTPGCFRPRQSTTATAPRHPQTGR